MSLGSSRRVYTKLGKWSNSWFLGTIILYALISVIAFAYLPTSLSRDRTLVGVAFLTSLLGLAALVAILGIVRDQVWAKWLTISIYGFVGLNAIGSFVYHIGNMVNSNGFGEVQAALMLSSAVSNLSALTRICMAGIGVVLVLQKPESQESD